MRRSEREASRTPSRESLLIVVAYATLGIPGCDSAVEPAIAQGEREAPGAASAPVAGRIQPRGHWPREFATPLNDGSPEFFEEHAFLKTATREQLRRPRFYPQDSLPFEFRVVMSPSDKPLKYDFGDYLVFFYYDGPRLSGATATDPTAAKMLAEVKFDAEYAYEGKTEALEIYYDSNSNPAHFGRSVFEDRSGEKLGEEETLGSKEREYFFLVAPLWFRAAGPPGASTTPSRVPSSTYGPVVEMDSSRHDDFMRRCLQESLTGGGIAVEKVVAEADRDLVLGALDVYLPLIVEMAGDLKIRRFPWAEERILNFDDLGVLVATIAHWYSKLYDETMATRLGAKMTTALTAASETAEAAVVRSQWKVCIDKYLGLARLAERFNNREGEAQAYSRLSECFLMSGDLSSGALYRQKAAGLSQ